MAERDPGARGVTAAARGDSIERTAGHPRSRGPVPARSRSASSLVDGGSEHPRSRGPVSARPRGALVRATWPPLLSALVLWACDDGASRQSVGAGGALGGTASDASPDGARPPDAGSDAQGMALDGSTSDAAGPADAAPDTACTTAFAYDPLGGARLETYPDDFYTRDDPASPTGLRPSLDPALAPWLATLPRNFQPVFGALEALDGWGTTAGVVLRFTAPLADVPDGSIRLVSLAGEQATEVPFEVQATDDGASLILWPMVPLAPKTRHGVVVSGLRDAAGGCVSPSPALQGLLDGSAADARLARLSPRYAELLTKTGALSVVAATVFTTQSTTDESEAIAADIAGRPHAWSEPPACVAAATWRECHGAFEAFDYRRDGHLVDGTPQSRYRLPVTAWLPLDGPSPYPTLVFGHGLGSGRDQAAALAEIAVPEGFAVVAIDAVQHGEHPTATASDRLTTTLAFFGVDLRRLALDALALRDNWRQSTYDKLQLLRLLRDAPDLDGDEAPDVDRLAYFGVSLGGIMGGELAALTPELGLVILSVPGGRVASIISEGRR